MEVVVQVARLQDGNRKLVSIAEAVRAENDKVLMQDIFVFERIA